MDTCSSLLTTPPTCCAEVYGSRGLQLPLDEYLTRKFDRPHVILHVPKDLPTWLWKNDDDGVSPRIEVKGVMVEEHE